jgi:fibronectin-binding autotransporter adhesin
VTADFPGSGGVNPFIDHVAGGAGAVSTGAFTFAALVKPAGNCGVLSARTASAQVRAMLVDSGKMFGDGDFSSGFGTVTSGTWYVMAITKPAGSAHYRMHLWPYASDGSGTMTHGESTGAGNHADGATTTILRIGSNDNRGNGVIAVGGFWDSALSDAQLDTLKSANLSAWSALSPKALISEQNWNGTTGSADVVGTSTFSSVTGTVNVGTDPPSFNYSLGATVVTAGSIALSGSGSLSSTGARIAPGPAALSGSGSLAAAAARIAAAPSVLSGSATLAAAAVRLGVGTAAFAGDGALAAPGRRLAGGAAALSADAALAGGSTVRLAAGAAATLAADGTLAAAAVRLARGTAALGADGTLTAAVGAPAVVLAGTVALTADGALTAAPARLVTAGAPFLADAALVAATRRLVAAGAALAGGGSLTIATPTVRPPTIGTPRRTTVATGRRVGVVTPRRE